MMFPFCAGSRWVAHCPPPSSSSWPLSAISPAKRQGRATPAPARIRLRRSSPDPSNPNQGTDMEIAISAVTAGLLSIYLFWTLLRPEDF